MFQIRHLIAFIYFLGIVTLPIQPASANPVANTSFKITEGVDVWLFEISHPESATCEVFQDTGYNYNCRLILQYRVSSNNTSRGIFGNGEVYDALNVKVGFFGVTTFMDSPSLEWKRTSLEIKMPKDGNVTLAFQSSSSRVFETISRKPIILKVKSQADQIADQATALEKEREEVLAKQRRQDAKKLSITCVKGKQKKTITGEVPICPAGFRNSMSSFATYQAFLKCQLYKKDSIVGGAELADRGRTLILNILASNGYSLDMLNSSDLACAKKVLNVSSFISTQIATTRAIDGARTAKWGKLSAVWNFHPDNGLNIAFNSK